MLAITCLLLSFCSYGMVCRCSVAHPVLMSMGLHPKYSPLVNRAKDALDILYAERNLSYLVIEDEFKKLWKFVADSTLDVIDVDLWLARIKPLP